MVAQDASVLYDKIKQQQKKSKKQNQSKQAKIPHKNSQTQKLTKQAVLIPWCYEITPHSKR